MTSPMPIETQNLGVTYHPGLGQKPRVGLRDLTLQVESGQVFGYLGANGAGKTTTIKALVGLLFPTRGRAWIYGEDVTHPKTRRHVGFLPENPYFYEYLTARESLHFYGRLAGLSRDDARARTDAMLEKVGLAHAVEQRVKGFSKGMRQRLGLAQALLHDPPLVILDEPMSGLDPRGRREVREIILELRDAGKTVFFSTHILPDVEMICDRVAILRGGELVMSGTMDRLVGASLQGIEISFAGAAQDTAQDAGRVWTTPEGHAVAEVASQEDADRLIDRVRDAGGHIISVTPLRRTLEDVFMDVVESKQEEAAVAAGPDSSEAQA
jgi:ABC-2 type transport system ATP-binding protein